MPTQPDTIAAISTPPGPGAIGILRLSGPRSLEIAAKTFRPLGPKALTDHAPRTLVYGDLLDEGGEPIDRCLCTFSRGPQSYTGEDTAEFQCHGSPMVLSLGLEALFAQLEAGWDEDAQVEDVIAGTQENYENYRLYGGILSFGESALDYCGRELRGAQGLHARLLGQAKADLESIAQFEARRLADPLDTGIKLRLERVEDRLVVETLEITEPAQQVRFLLHGLGIENRDPAFRGSAEMEDGIVVYESREGPSGGYEYVRGFSLVGGECLAVIDGEEGIVSGTAPRETYDFVASYFEG